MGLWSVANRESRKCISLNCPKRFRNGLVTTPRKLLSKLRSFKSSKNVRRESARRKTRTLMPIWRGRWSNFKLLNNAQHKVTKAPQRGRYPAKYLCPRDEVRTLSLERFRS